MKWLPRLLLVALIAPAWGQVKVSALPASGGVNGTDITIDDNGTTTQKATYAQVEAYVASVLGLGTFATQNYATPPAIGGTTPAAGAFTTLSASSTVSGTGFSTYLASPPAIGGATAAAGTFSALTDSGITGSTQCLHVNTSGVVSGTGSDCGSGGSPAWSSVTAGSNTATLTMGTGGSLSPTGSGVISANEVNGATVPASAALVATNGLSQATAVSTGSGLTIASATLSVTQAINAQTGTSYTIASTDASKLLTFSNASAIAVTLPVATTTGFGAGFAFDTENLGAGLVTITPTTSTINGAATLTVAKNAGCSITSDGTNYQVSACTALAGTVTSVAETVPTGFSVSGSPITGSGTLAISYSGPVVGGTKFTEAPTGCTPSATAGGATAGTITLASGPCTSIVITMNGATGLTAPNGWSCNVHDRTASTIPAWGETSSTTTTATIPVPGAAGATDMLSFNCTGF
jgi:hypothetical protein